jgi:hypothetical protein
MISGSTSTGRPEEEVMAAADLFPTDLTEGERSTGFVQQAIENPDAHYVGQPQTITAVVCTLSASRRIVKIRLPGDRVGYQLQRHGHYSFFTTGRKPEWLPDLNFSIHDPVFAVQYFQSELAEARGMGSRIVEVTDSSSSV